MATGEQRHDHALEHRLLADDHALDLEQRGLERVVGLPRGGAAARLLVVLQGPQAGLVGCHVAVSLALGLLLIGTGAERHVERLRVAVSLDNHLHGIAGLAREHHLAEIRRAA